MSAAVVVTTDWQIGTTDRIVLGSCSVDVSPPFDYMSFTRGFPLHSPCSRRCALYSFILGLELVEGNGDLAKEYVVVSSKSSWLEQALKQYPRWTATGKWPKDSGSYKNMLTRVWDLIHSLPEKHTFVFIKREEGEKSEIKLDEHTSKENKAGGVDVEDIAKSADPRKEMDKRLREQKASELMIQKALATGARISQNKKK